MIADGYRIFVNGCVAASFVEVTVAKNSEKISGAGYGDGFVTRMCNILWMRLCIHSHEALEGRR